jgi:hypothetical protein
VKEQRVGISSSQSRGWVPLMRTLTDHPIMRRPEALSLYIHLLLRARYNPGLVDLNGKILQLGVGEAVYGREETARALRLTAGQVRTSQQFLEKTGLITRKATSRGTIVSVCDYEAWALGLNADRPANDQPTTSRTTTNEYVNTETKKEEEKRSTSKAGAPFSRNEGIESEDEILSEYKAEVRLAQAWSELPGVRRADPSYVSDGLARRGIDATEVQELIDGITRYDVPENGESLWAWFRRMTGEWLGSEVEYSQRSHDGTS